MATNTQNDTNTRSDFMPDKPFDANTGRHWKDYIKVLNLDEITDWNNKTIVDLGSSYKPNWGMKAADYFPGAKVIAVDPSFIINGDGAYPIEEYNKYQIKNMSTDYDENTERRIGVAQDLPIDNHSVDFVFSLMAVPLHLPINHQGRMLAEMLRVLKAGGEARLSPFGTNKDNFFANLLKTYGYEIVQYTHDGDEFKNLPKNGITIKVPKDFDEIELHENYLAFVNYLHGMNIYAENKDWDTDYFNNPEDFDFTPSIPSPLKGD